MNYFKRIMKGTLFHLLRMVGATADREIENEIDGAFDDLEQYIDARIAAAIAAHVAAENAELATTVPGWEERQRGEVE